MHSQSKLLTYYSVYSVVYKYSLIEQSVNIRSLSVYKYSLIEQSTNFYIMIVFDNAIHNITLCHMSYLLYMYKLLSHVNFKIPIILSLSIRNFVDFAVFCCMIKASHVLQVTFDEEVLSS